MEDWPPPTRTKIAVETRKRSPSRGFCFRQPAAAQFFCGNARHIRLDVKNRRSVKHIDPVNEQRSPFSAQKFHNRQPDRIRAPRRARGEYAMRLIVHRRRAHQIEALGSVENPEHKQMRESFYVFKTQFKLRQDFKDAFCIMLHTKPFWNR